MIVHKYRSRNNYIMILEQSELTTCNETHVVRL